MRDLNPGLVNGRYALLRATRDTEQIADFADQAQANQ